MTNRPVVLGLSHSVLCQFFMGRREIHLLFCFFELMIGLRELLECWTFVVFLDKWPLGLASSSRVKSVRTN